MNKKLSKKPTRMSLHRDTLRQLDARTLQTAAGGYSLPAQVCQISNETCDPCPTYSCGPRPCL